MGNTIVRSFVLVLAVAGFTATSFSAHASRTEQSSVVKTMNSKLGMVSEPAALCAPGSTCGMQ